MTVIFLVWRDTSHPDGGGSEVFVERISAELAQQYVLSYYPENEADQRGAFRTISLAVKTRQNLTVRTRKGYYVPRK